MRAVHAVRAVQGVDRLVPLLFNIQNENESPFQEANAAAAGVAEGRPDFRAEEYEESNLMHSINGWVSNPLVGEGGTQSLRGACLADWIYCTQGRPQLRPLHDGWMGDTISHSACVPPPFLLPFCDPQRQVQRPGPCCAITPCWTPREAPT